MCVLQIPSPTADLIQIQSDCVPNGTVIIPSAKIEPLVMSTSVHTQPMPSPAAFRPHPTQVHEDYNCTLNQTNIGNNNNKFYIIQLLEEDGHFFCWNRWGRVVSDPLPVCLPQTALLCTHFKSPQRAPVAGCPTSPSAGQHTFLMGTPLKVVTYRERWARPR